jgi:hypothetical protein
MAAAYWEVSYLFSDPKAAAYWEVSYMLSEAMSARYKEYRYNVVNSFRANLIWSAFLYEI